MDQHGQIGPESGDYANDVSTLANLLKVGGPVFVTLADGEGSADRMICCLRDKIGSYGQSLDEYGAPEGEGYMLVALDRGRSYVFDLTAYKAPDFVQDKLHPGCRAEAVAEFIERVGFALGLRGEVK